MSGSVPAVLAMAGRGRLPYAPLHRLPLYLHALHALAASGVRDIVVAVDEVDRRRVERDVREIAVVAQVCSGTGWWDRLGADDVGSGLLVHDALCPLASAAFIGSMLPDARAGREVSVLAYRPVTDTVKTVVDSRIHGTIDREALAALVSPAVIAPGVLSAALAADDCPPVDDFTQLAVWLRARGEVDLVRAPSLGRRVDDASAVNLLECVDELDRQVRRGPGGGPGAVSDAGDPGTR